MQTQISLYETEFIELNIKKLFYPIGKYLDAGIQTIHALAQEFVTHLGRRKVKPKRITFWVRGTSGAMLAGIILQYLTEHNHHKVTVHIVRKPDEDSHGSNYSLYYECGDEYVNVIVDDFICTGSTLDKIYQTIYDKRVECHKEEHPSPVVDYLIVSGQVYPTHVEDMGIATVICGE